MAFMPKTICVTDGNCVELLRASQRSLAPDRTVCEICVGMGMPIFVNSAPTTRPKPPMASTSTLSNAMSLPPSPATSYCRRLFGSLSTA